MKTIEVSASGLSRNNSGSNNNEIVIGMELELHKAAIESNIDAFEEKGAEIEGVLTPNKNTILHIHFTADNHGVSMPFVQQILNMCPALVLKPNAKGETLLHIAARFRHSIIVTRLIELAKALLEAGSKKRLIRATTKNGDTLLHEAVCYHHTRIVDILTTKDPDYSYFGNSEGETPLYIAAERNYYNVVIKILENCKSPNQDGPLGKTSLHAAVIHNKKEMVPKLLTRTSVKQADENGWVPLHLAALYGFDDMTEVLLNYDRSIAYKRDNKGRTALHFAAHFGHERNVIMIIKHYPDCAELVDEKGYNALHYTAISKEGTYWAADVIMDNASLINLSNEKDENGNTPLHRLAISDSLYYDHPLLEVNSTVDTMAFIKQNHTAMDIGFDEFRHASSGSKQGYRDLISKLQDIGARYDKRIISKDGRKKKHNLERYDSEDGRKKNQEDKDKHQEDKDEHHEGKDEHQNIGATFGMRIIFKDGKEERRFGER